VVTAAPQRLAAISPLCELILGNPIWVRTNDGTLYPAPRSATTGLNWGYAGSGHGALALLVIRLLDDITSEPADQASGAPDGLETLMEQKWPAGTVLPRAVLEAARDGRPYEPPPPPTN